MAGCPLLAQDRNIDTADIPDLGKTDARKIQECLIAMCLARVIDA